MTVVLGAIADDFTGATDLASTWARQGLRVVQTIGVADDANVAEGAARSLSIAQRNGVLVWQSTGGPSAE